MEGLIRPLYKAAAWLRTFRLADDVAWLHANDEGLYNGLLQNNRGK
jgi:hypothetical protein